MFLGYSVRNSAVRNNNVTQHLKNNGSLKGYYKFSTPKFASAHDFKNNNNPSKGYSKSSAPIFTSGADFENNIGQYLKRDDLNTLNELIKNGFDINNRIVSLLFYACENGFINIMSHLYPKCFCHINRKGLMELALEKNKINIVKYLLDHALKNGQKDILYLALHTACEKGLLDVLKLILKYRKKIIIDFDEAYEYAAKNYNFDVIKIMMENGISSSKCHNIVLTMAISSKNEDFVSYLLDKKCENISYSDPLILAAKKDLLNMIVLLTEKYNYSEFQLTNALMEACKNGNFEIVKHLIAKGASVNTHDWNYLPTPMTCALNCDHENNKVINEVSWSIL
jgi:ankyrin repeat protein